jgi:thiamine biosynthesis lipoprotein
MAEIHVFKHHAMATYFEARISGEEKSYAEGAAQNAFALLDRLENHLSRFRASSDISRIAQLSPGEKLRVSEPAFACLEIGKKMELATRGAFSVAPAALKSQPAAPRWILLKEMLSIRCESGKLEFDLGAIGKGFALDRMARELQEWDCPSFLLVAGGSSILAGAPPEGLPGWSSGLGDDNAEHRYWLKNCSLSGSGVAVKGEHIFDPRTGKPARQRSRAWALASSGAESDALSTACMVLSESEIAEVAEQSEDWLVLLNDGRHWIHYGRRESPCLVTESR